MNDFKKTLSPLLIFRKFYSIPSAAAFALLVASFPHSSSAQAPPPLPAAEPAAPADPSLPAVPESVPDPAPETPHTLPPKPVFVPPDLVPLVEIMDTFFNTLAKEGSSKAYRDLLKGSSLLSQTAVVTDVITNTDAAFKAFGNLEAFERIDIKRTGERIVSVTYIGSCPRWPIRWNFVCYFAGGRWQILDIDVSNDLDLMIDRGRKRSPADPSE